MHHFNALNPYNTTKIEMTFFSINVIISSIRVLVLFRKTWAITSKKLYILRGRFVIALIEAQRPLAGLSELNPPLFSSVDPALLD